MVSVDPQDIWNAHAGAPVGQRLAVLSGLKVVDLTRFLAGPAGAMVLADMGADVLKVEQFVGDSTRTGPPYFFEGDGAYFMAINRNKRSIALDIKSKGGYGVLKKLIAGADILLDNLRAPQRKALKLSWEELEAINPKIVSVSVTGFGSDGPYADRPAYDIIVEAIGGVMSVTGPVGGPSVRAGVPIGDINAGLYTAISALAGLQTVRTTGKGLHLDVSMLDVQVSLLSYLAQYYFTGGLIASHQGRAHLSIPTYNTFATKDDSEIVIAANETEQFISLCHVFDRDDLPKDPRFEDRANRLKNREDLLPILRDEFKKWDRTELDKALVAAEVPVAPINSIDQTLNDQQVLHREMVVKAPHRSGKEYLTLGVPVKADHVGPRTLFLTPPGLGQHTIETMLGLGYTQQEIDQLEADGAVLSDRQPPKELK